MFVNGLVENPAFNSQSKEALTSKDSLFGSVPKLSDAALKAIEKSEIVERCVVCSLRQGRYAKYVVLLGFSSDMSADQCVDIHILLYPELVRCTVPGKFF